jgi:hypothetical protein
MARPHRRARTGWSVAVKRPRRREPIAEDPLREAALERAVRDVAPALELLDDLGEDLVEVHGSMASAPR